MQDTVNTHRVSQHAVVSDMGARRLGAIAFRQHAAGAPDAGVAKDGLQGAVERVLIDRDLMPCATSWRCKSESLRYRVRLPAIGRVRTQGRTSGSISTCFPLAAFLGIILGQWDSKTARLLSHPVMNGYKGNCLILKGLYGGQGRSRTTDTRIFSPPYRLLSPQNHAGIVPVLSLWLRLSMQGDFR